jgi:outer membrane protein OmpA-like peptidoglycan-associated protein
MHRIPSHITIALFLGSAAPAIAQTAGEAAMDREVAVSAEQQATQEPTLQKQDEPVAAETPPVNDRAVATAQRNDQSRKAALSVANTLDGPSGLLRVMSADSSEKGTFRVSATGTFYKGSGFLCPACTDVNGTTLAGKDQVGYSATRLQASMTPLNFLEAFASMRFRTVSNDHGQPHVIQMSGDTILGAKAFMPYRPGRIFTLGGGLALSLLAKNRSIGPAFANVDLMAAGTLDLRELPANRRIPLRAHLNLGYRFDNSGTIADGIEAKRNSERISRVERFGFGINRTDAIRFGLGAEWVFAYARPFIEWSMDISANRQGYKCRPRTRAAGDQCLDSAREFAALPSRLSFGVRGYPWRASWAEGVMLLAAVDIGTGATAKFVEETMPELPWAISVGLGYSGGARPRVEIRRVVQEKKVEVANPLPPELYVRGKVTEKDSPAAVAGAAVRLVDSDTNAMLTDDNGNFRTLELAPGKYVLRLSKDGYAANECEAVVPAPSKQDKPAAKSGKRAEIVTEVPCAMARLPAVAAVTGVLRDAETTLFVPRAAVSVLDPKGRKVSLDTDEYGGFRFENVPAGKLKIQALADGYLPSGAEVELKARENVTVQMTAHKRPKLASVTVAKNELKLRRQLHFLHDSAEILPDSMGIVEEIAEAVRTHPDISQVEIQGHTDDSGTPEHNRALSSKRANSVRDALIVIGVEPNRLVARGYGQDKPLVPNSTEANRAKNRRVQLVIVGP